MKEHCLKPMAFQFGDDRSLRCRAATILVPKMAILCKCVQKSVVLSSPIDWKHAN